MSMDLNDAASSTVYGSSRPHSLNTSMASNPGKIPDAISIFQEACEQFRVSLSRKQLRHFKEFPDAESMLRSIQSEVKNHPLQTSLLTRCCKKISSLSAMLSPFFQVINMMVSSHPEFAAMAWGSIRLVFVLGTNHAEFLERVCELFEAMSMKLPAYEKYMNEISAAIRRRGGPSPARLFTAMSYVYADLIQFCFDICQLFSRKRSRFIALRGSFRNSLPASLLNPFNVRYDTLLRRWAQHQNLIELEMQVMSNLEQAETTTRIESMLGQFIREGGFEDSNIEQNQWSRDSEKIRHRLQSWINPPSWLDMFENSQNQREPDSTEWLVHHDGVSRWLAATGEPRSSPHRVLSVQGKPGYGKTTLCTTLIEHLQKQNLRTAESSGRKIALTFFYFDKQRPDTVSSGAIWRAVLAQLLHAMPAFDSDAVDIFLLFRENRFSGQAIASDNEVFSVLKLLIQRLDQLYLVVDGVDECLDPAHFLKRLTSLLDFQDSAVAALFSRPTLTVPTRLMKSTTILSLGTDLNLADIEIFLRSRIMALIEDGLLPDSHDPEEITVQVASRASGMFLWAALFMDYLQSPHISVRERHEAIRDVNWLEGLDSLYGAILRSLKRSTAGKAKKNIAQAFELVGNSCRPLHVSELQYAMATPMDRAVDRDDLIPNFSNNIGILSGALMELDHHGFVRFVHLSVIEYLTDASVRDSTRDTSSDFFIDRHSSHRSFASRCLSYLTYSVKSQPLAGEPHTAPFAGDQVRKYPLLDYATEFWSFHVLECLESMALYPLGDSGSLMVELASKFLSTQPSVMVWIEACWMFGRAPQIRHGPSDAFFQKGLQVPLQLDSRVRTIYEKAWATLQQLSQDLEKINNSWSHILKDEPHEIWEPSLSAFHRSPFWQRISGADISAQFQANSDDHESICLKTQLSVDGSRLGLVRLHASPGDEVRASVFFELWSIEPNKKLHEVNLRIAGSCMKPFLPRAWGGFFQFPIAITADFRQVAAPGCVVQVPRLGEDEEEPNNISIDDLTQFIDFTGNSWTKGPFKFGIEDFQLNYDIQISETGEYLMTVHKSDGTVDISDSTSCQLRLVNVYQNLATSGSKRPSYCHVGSLAFKPMYLHATDPDGDWCALLHPRCPTVAFKFRRVVMSRDAHGQIRGIPYTLQSAYTEMAAGLWNFEISGDQSLRCTAECPERLRFDHDGEYFSGMAVNTWGSRRRLIESAADSGRSVVHCPGREVAHLRDSRWEGVALPSRAARPAVQRLGEINNYTDRYGTQSVTQLEDSGSAGIMLATLREDGRIKAEMLTRLPSAISTDYKAALLNTKEGGGQQDRRIFLDRADQPFRQHHLGDGDETAGAQLPLVLKRQQSTIPTVMGRGQYSLKSGLRAVGESRKRIGLFADEREAKRRDSRGCSAQNRML